MDHEQFHRFTHTLEHTLAADDRVLHVVQMQARCGARGSVEVWSVHAGANPERRARSPNTPLQPTAARTRSCFF